MHITKSQWTIIIVNAVYLICFGIYYIMKKNYEFMIYIGIVLFFAVLIGLSIEKVKYTNGVLWGLTAWGFFHMAGGSFPYKDGRWYDTILIPISESYQIFKYDQAIHIYGFFIATLVVWQLLKPILKKDIDKWTALSIVVVMAGLGFGALNEIVEFGATLVMPNNGVGGYINTSLDLVSDIIGAIIAMVVIYIKERK